MPLLRAIAKRNRPVDYLDDAHNFLVRIVHPVLFYRLQFVLAIPELAEALRSIATPWLEAVGELEALGSTGRPHL